MNITPMTQGSLAINPKYEIKEQYYSQIQALYKDMLLRESKITDIQESNQNVRIRCGKKIESFRASKIFNNKAFMGILNKFWKNDVYITMNTFISAPHEDKYKRQGTSYMKDLYAVNCFCLDIDYKKTGNEHSDPLSYYYECIANIIPLQPNWIEYGHNLRLIYILADTIKYRVKNSKTAINLVKRVQRYIADKLNSELDCTCEVQPLNSYLRVAGSINSRDSSIINYTKITNEKYTIQDIVTEYLPDLPEWYESWKTRKKAKSVVVGQNGNTNIYKIYNSYQLWSDRAEAFKKLRTYNGINREKLIFWYGVSLIWTKQDDDIIQALLEFNKGFTHPYNKKLIQSKFRTLKELFIHNKGYQIKSNTLIQDLRIDDEIAKEYGIMGKREQLKIEKIARGETRQQIAEKNYLTFKMLRNQGMKLNDIAEQMKMSIDTIKRYGRRLKKEVSENE